MQNAVDNRRLGQATSATQFFRQIGGAVGTAALGAVLALTLTTALGPGAASGQPAGAAGLPPLAVREAYALATHNVYTLAFGFAVAGWLITLLVPSLPLRKTFEADAGRGSEVGPPRPETAEATVPLAG